MPPPYNPAQYTQKHTSKYSTHDVPTLLSVQRSPDDTAPPLCPSGQTSDPLWVETFTGLRMRQYEGLLRVVRERGGSGPGGGGRPWCLPLADRVLLVAVYYRTNLTV